MKVFNSPLILCPCCLGLIAASVRAEQAGTIEEITVTARKRPELLREVPFGITAFTAESMTERRIGDPESLFREVPNLNLSTFGDARSSFFSIRGVGPIGLPVSTDDSSVIVYVDGVPQPSFGSDFRFLDAERIEVLRGPQGTLFGRNAQAGAINIVTRQPSNSSELRATLEAGTEDSWRLQGSASGPLIEDRLFGKGSARYSTLGGYVPNVATGARLGDNETIALNGALLVHPGNEATQVNLNVFGERQKTRPSYYVLANSSDAPIVSLNPDGRVDRDVAGVSLSLTHETRSVVLTSVSSYNHLDANLIADDLEGFAFAPLFGMTPEDFSPVTDLTAWSEEQNSFYQEVRLNSPGASDIAWVAGVNYLHDRFKSDYENRSVYFATTNGHRRGDNTTSSYATFGEATLPLSARWKGTLGLRYTRDEKRYEARYTGNGFPGTPALFQQTEHVNSDLVTGRLALTYESSEDTNLYATVGRGAKSGGFPRFTNNAASGSADETYRSSTSWALEAGSKSRLLDGRMTLNLAAFLNDVQDEHLFTLDFASFRFVPVNIDTRSYGLEAEGTWRVLPGLDVIGSLGYTNARLRNLTASATALTGAADDNRVPGVARLTTSLTLQLEGSAAWLGLDAAGIFGHVTHQYASKRAADAANGYDLPAYHIVNAKLGMELQDFRIYAYADNLGDEQAQLIGALYAPGVPVASFARGRVMGLGISFDLQARR